ncbi:MAG: phage head-tail connector protein [Novosphingobium sp.]|nr:phage head-tail connector protein [Novosphingobium sp.]
MNRVILTPPVLPSATLAELKQWLGITTPRDDSVLSALLAAALETCEAFTCRMPLVAPCEEVLPVRAGWQALSTRPVQAITGIEGIVADGSRLALPYGAYEIDLDADGTGRVRLSLSGAARKVAVRFTAGLADDWDSLPDGLRHGLIRLAAHQHRERDGSAAASLPPASVAALWRPWRRMRLA